MTKARCPLPSHLRTFHLSAKERQEAAVRAAFIQRLGMAPEPEGLGEWHPEAYAASTGEMGRWIAEEYGVAERDRIAAEATAMMA